MKMTIECTPEEILRWLHDFSTVGCCLKCGQTHWASQKQFVPSPITHIGGVAFVESPWRKLT